jgi:hypothetical protein
MSNRRAKADSGAEGTLAASWSDVWAGLVLTLFLGVGALLVVIFFSGGT